MMKSETLNHSYSFQDSFGRITFQISKSLGKKLEDRFIKNGCAINAMQWTVLSMVYQNPGLTQQQIGKHLLMDKVSVKRSLDQMERQNLVTRTFAKNDKRAKQIYLTAYGSSMYYKLRMDAELTLSDAFANLSQEEHEKLIELLKRILMNLQY